MARQRVDWRIWYEDNSSFGSEDGLWDDAPIDRVLFVLETFDDGKKLVHMGADYYVMRDAEVIDFSLAHLERHLRDVPGWKFGKWASDEAFAAAHEEVFGCRPT